MDQRQPDSQRIFIVRVALFQFLCHVKVLTDGGICPNPAIKQHPILLIRIFKWFDRRNLSKLSTPSKTWDALYVRTLSTTLDLLGCMGSIGTLVWLRPAGSLESVGISGCLGLLGPQGWLGLG